MHIYIYTDLYAYMHIHLVTRHMCINVHIDRVCDKTHPKEPYILAKEPYTSAKEPYNSDTECATIRFISIEEMSVCSVLRHSKRALHITKRAQHIVIRANISEKEPFKLM